jgi:hypothetical protein
MNGRINEEIILLKVAWAKYLQADFNVIHPAI